MQRAGLGQVMRENPQESVVEGGFRCSDCVFRSVCRFAGRDGVRGAGTFGRRAGECRFFFVSLHKTPCCGRYYSCRADRRFLPLHLSDSNSGCLRRKKCRFFPECFSNAEEFAGVSCDQRISAIFFRAGPVPHFVRRRPRCGIAAVPCQQMLNTKNNSL